MNIELIILVLATAALFPFVIGMLVLYHLVIRAKQAPCDESNRINHIRLFWFALTREDRFTEMFPWLLNDEWENFND